MTVRVFVFFLCALFCCLHAGAQAADEIGAKKTAITLPFASGEVLTYDVYFKSLRIGTSILTFHGLTEYDGDKYFHITFSTDIRAFRDTEQIYADPSSFLPVFVNRDIKELGIFPYTISEHYDQTRHSITIIKKGKLLSKTITLQKDAPVHNAILLPYYYRAHAQGTVDEKIRIVLPLAEFDVVLEGKETLSVPAGEFDAFLYKSIPSKFSFWLSADARKIPLKIESLTAIGYSLILTSVEGGAGS